MLDYEETPVKPQSLCGVFSEKYPKNTPEPRLFLAITVRGQQTFYA